MLGDVDPATLGVTNSHDHLFFRSVRLPGQELADVAAAAAEARAFAEAGGATIVQWTPRGRLSPRRPAGDRSGLGLNIVAATGRHRAEHYEPGPVVASVDQLASAFLADVTRGTSPCGLVKIGTGYHHLDQVEGVSLEAAAHAHHESGVPIAVHLELGTGGDLVLDALHRHGVEPGAVVLGHIGRDPAEDSILDLAATGAFLCFDGPSRANHRTDWRTPACIETLIDHGHLGQILVGGDTTTAAARSVTGGPGMPGLLNRFGRRIGGSAARPGRRSSDRTRHGLSPSAGGRGRRRRKARVREAGRRPWSRSGRPGRGVPGAA